MVHRPDGDLVVEAPDAADHWYVAGLELSDSAGAARPVTSPSVEHGDLTGGATLRFGLSATPTRWGVPSSDAGEAPAGAGPAGAAGFTAARPWQRLDGRWRGADGSLEHLTDGDLTTSTEVGGRLEWRPAGQVPEGAVLRAYTLTSSAGSAGRPPSAWRLATSDGRVLDERSGEAWPWPGQLRPFVLDEPVPLTGPAAPAGLWLELLDGGVLAQVELLVS